MKTRAFVYAGSLMVVAATVTVMFPNQSFADTGWGTYTYVTEQDNFESATGGAQYVPTATSQIQSRFNTGLGPGLSSAVADMVTGTVGLSATFTDADSTGAFANLYETIHVGVVPMGAEGFLTLSGDVAVTPVPLTSAGTDDYRVDNDAQVTLLVNTGDSYLASPFIGLAQMRVESETGTNFSRTVYDTNGVDNISTGNSTSLGGSLTTSFALTSNTDYFVELQSQVGVNNTIFSSPFQSSGYYDGSNIYTATVDPPNWSFTASPGVSYTTASGYQFGSPLSIAAPEASSVALLGFAALPLGIIVLRRMRRIG